MDMELAAHLFSEKPLCPVFGKCGGCSYQDISYAKELEIKDRQLKDLFLARLGVKEDCFASIFASPQKYFYRNRLDIKLIRTKRGEILLGFSPHGVNKIVPVTQCPIARTEISEFLPDLKTQAGERLPPKYRMANLVVRSGDLKKVFWGGIGQKSLRQNPKDYFFTEIHGKRIFYSLDTFFQANLFILPGLIQTIAQFSIWKDRPVFFDLYGGVGLFAICLKDLVHKTFLIEESPHSIALARYNKLYHDFTDLELIEGKVEEKLPALLQSYREKSDSSAVVFIDPPRAGISSAALEVIISSKHLESILYLSCHPDSLVRDLSSFLENGWGIKRVLPFDFFPRTKHIETLVILQSKGVS